MPAAIPGPLPTGKARRRNAPTFATTVLPAAGRKGPAPKPPMDLGAAGMAWWVWAWKTPQAASWGPGSLYALVRRASLQDDLEALELVDDFDLEELFGIENDNKAGKRLEWMIRKLKALAGGKMAIAREARELDAHFGLTERAMLQLRWAVGEAEEEAKPSAPKSTIQRHLRAVDRAVAGA